jgi:hypothetical protein
MKRALIVLTLLGCSQRRTEVMVGIATDLSAPDALDAVKMDVFREGVLLFDLPAWPIPGAAGDRYELPASFGVYSADASEPRIEVHVKGLKSEQKIVERTAIFSLISEHTLFLRMGLVVRCRDMGDCPSASQTCVEGRCVPVEVDSRTFPEYAPGAELSVACSGPTAFIDTKTGQPMPISGKGCAPGELCQEGTCYRPVGGTGSTCDPVQQTCPGGQRCTLDHSTPPKLFCDASSGLQGEYQRCIATATSDECARGLTCLSNSQESTCRRFCAGNGDCGTDVCSLGVGMTGLHACAQSCSVLTQGCTLPSEACYFATTVGAPAQQCLPAGSKTEGQTCAKPNDCARGLLCTGTPLACRRPCDTSAPACPSGQSCRPLTAQLTVGFCQ